LRSAPRCIGSRRERAPGTPCPVGSACKYVARPPLAAGRLTQVSDDLLSFRLKTPWSDGTTAILLSPTELIEKLSALVPPPRKHLVRYHGLLAPNAKQRAKIVPATADSEQSGEQSTSTPRRYRLSWAALLARTFNLKLERCAQCGGEMRIVAVVTHPDSIRRYLEGTGHSPDIPEIAPARAPPQDELDFGC